MRSGSGHVNRVSQKVVWAGPNSSVDLDIRCAARSTVPVLITGPAHAAESVALEIHRRGSGGARSFTVVDCQNPVRLISALKRGKEPEGGTLLLRGIHRLSPAQQVELAEILRGSKRRIVASTTVRLRNDGRFDETLFYRLNVIHIDLGNEN